MFTAALRSALPVSCCTGRGGLASDGSCAISAASPHTLALFRITNVDYGYRLTASSRRRQDGLGLGWPGQRGDW